MYIVLCITHETHEQFWLKERKEEGRYPTLQHLTDTNLLFIEPVVSVTTADIVGHE